MKKYIIAVLIAGTIGLVFAFFIFNKTSDDDLLASNDAHKVYLFQLGVFSDFDNADAQKEKSGAAIITQINEYYYVYGAIYSDINLVSLIKNYYDELDIDYAIKEVVITNEFYEELDSYENLLLETNNMEVILKTNQIILDKYAIL